MGKFDYPEKVIMIFNGITKLMSEGNKLYAIKVSDIAKAAGIGKGTIYEYFTSKEEILEKVLLYNMNLEISIVIERVNNTNGFKNKIYSIFQFIQEEIDKNKSPLSLLVANLDPYEFNKLLNKDLEVTKDREIIINDTLKDIINTGIQEGIIKEQNDEKYELHVITSVLTGFLHLVCSNNNTIKEEIERSYKLLVKGLS